MRTPGPLHIIAAALLLTVALIWHFNRESARDQAREEHDATSILPNLVPGAAPVKRVPAAMPPAGAGSPRPGAAVVPALMPPAFYSEPLARRRPDIYANAQVIRMEESRPDSQGNFIRIRLLKTSFKYPLVRVDERLNIGDGSGQPRLLKRVAMVADHVMVRLQPGYTADDLMNLVVDRGGYVRSNIAQSEFYLIGFDGSHDPHALERMVRDLRNSGVVASPEPDYIVMRD